MKPISRRVWCSGVLALLAAPTGALAAERPAPPAPESGRRWIAFPDPRLEIRGLPWLRENSPELWRLPQGQKARLPAAVWRRGVAPDGGRIRFTSTSAELRLRVQAATAPGRNCFLDAYVDGVLAGSARVPGPGAADLVLFEGKGAARKAVTVYLPNNHELRVLAVGLEAGAELVAAPAFAAPRPVVCYGSSVLQGTGAFHPGQTYPAALARQLNLDFVNLGFGGAGKAEPAVVELVNQLDAACFILDLGKSYGDQGPEPYRQMLAALRARHPDVPIFCVTPIYSTKEPAEPAYREKSIRLRALMRAAAEERRAAGEAQTFVVEGLDLFGEADRALFRDPQHPNDEGNALIAQRLSARVAAAVLGRP